MSLEQRFRRLSFILKYYEFVVVFVVLVVAIKMSLFSLRHYHSFMHTLSFSALCTPFDLPIIAFNTVIIVRIVFVYRLIWFTDAFAS